MIRAIKDSFIYGLLVLLSALVFMVLTPLLILFGVKDLEIDHKR